jgi:autotransporter-associated beta strand protein
MVNQARRGWIQLALGLSTGTAVLAGPSFEGPKTVWTGTASTLWSDDNNWACDYSPCIPIQSLFTAILGSQPVNTTSQNDLPVDQLRNLQVVGSGYRVTGNPLSLDGLQIGQSSSGNRFQLAVQFQRDALLEILRDGSVDFEGPVRVGHDVAGPLYIQSLGTATFSGGIQGSGGLVIQGVPGISMNATAYNPGRVRLPSPNGFSGRIEILQGYAQLLATGTLGDLTRETIIGPSGQLELGEPGIRSGEAILLAGDGPARNGEPFTVRGALRAYRATHQLHGLIRLAADASIHVDADGLLGISNVISSDVRGLLLTKRGAGILELQLPGSNVLTRLHVAEGVVRIPANGPSTIPRFIEPILVGGETNPATLSLALVAPGTTDLIAPSAALTLGVNGSLQLGRATEALGGLFLEGGSIEGESNALLESGPTLVAAGDTVSTISVNTRFPAQGSILSARAGSAQPLVDFAGLLTGGPLTLDGSTVEFRGSGQNAHSSTHLRSGILRLDKVGGAQPHHLSAGRLLTVGIPDPDAPLATARCQSANQFHPLDADVEVLASGFLILKETQSIARLTLSGGTVSNGLFRVNESIHVLAQPKPSRIEAEELRIGDPGVTVDCAADSPGGPALEIVSPMVGSALSKDGRGTLRLAGTSTHASTTVLKGALRVDGDHGSTPVTLTPNTILSGTGAVGFASLSNNVRLELGAPDGSAGTLVVGGIGFGRSNVLAGVAQPSGSDRLRVTGTVSIGADCRLRWGFRHQPALNERFVLIQNDGTDPIVGQFGNAPEGGSYTNQAMVFRVSYVGGTGNDLALEYIGTGGGPTNRPPELAALPDRNATEGELLSFNATATDPDAGQRLQFSTSAPLPPGATLDPATGAFTWTPGERQGARVFDIEVRATDDGIPSQTVTRSFRVTVAERNQSPVLPDPGLIQISQGETLSLLLDGSDADIPAQSLTYEVLSGAPAGMTLNSSTGRLRWQPSNDLPSSTNQVILRLRDSATPPATIERTVTVQYRSLNRPPTITPIPPLNLAENGGFDLQLQASDPETPAGLLRWEFAAPAPSWLSLGSNGQLLFIEGEETGPSTNTVQVRVLDNGSPQQSQTASFEVVVREVNRPPTAAYATVPDLRPGDSLARTPTTLSDPDLPLQPLRFRLLGEIPPGLVLTTNTGALAWTVPQAHPPTTYRLAVVVTDEPPPGIAALSHTNVVTIRTIAGTTVTASTLRLTLLSSSEAELTWDSIPGTSYRIERRSSLNSGTWLLETEVTPTTNPARWSTPVAAEVRFFRVVAP